MKSVRYFTLNYTGFTTAACEKQGYLRLIAGEHVFYTDKRYFKDPALFDRLTINQPLHLGVRRLDNGCYWIHWLSDGETLLEPSQRVTRWARPLLIISLLTLIVALIPLVMSTSEWGRFGCGIIAILAFIGLLTGLYERLFHPVLKRHPAMRDLLTKMAQARRRDFSFCQRLPATARAVRQSAMPFTQALPERYAVRTGKISNIIFKKWFAGNPTREYHGVGIMRHGAAGLLVAGRLRQFRAASRSLSSSATVYRHWRSPRRRVRARQPCDPRAIQCQRRRGLYKKPSTLSRSPTTGAALLPVLRPRAGDVSAISRC